MRQMLKSTGFKCGGNVNVGIFFWPTALREPFAWETDFALNALFNVVICDQAAWRLGAHLAEDFFFQVADAVLELDVLHAANLSLD